MAKIKLSRKDPNPLSTVRQIVLERLRNDPSWSQYGEGRWYEPFVEYQDGADERMLEELAREVIWELMIEGVLMPGLNSMNPGHPWFSKTNYGKQVIQSVNSTPHDPDGYLKRIKSRVATVDATVMAYVQEAINTYRNGDSIASAVMLGIAAERVFLLLCDSTQSALGGASEQQQFKKIMDRFAMKPKLDWVHTKFQSIQGKVSGFPDTATLMVDAIYDLLRVQRNDLGHPQNLPPSISREDAFVSLQIFPRYYETAEETRTFLASNKI